jgi:hypothetical protein
VKVAVKSKASDKNPGEGGTGTFDKKINKEIKEHTGEIVKRPRVRISWRLMNN